VIGRARALAAHFRRDRTPDVLLSASRSSALAARWMGIPSFVIDDYEHANSSFYRLTRTTILHPDVIDPAPFLESGISPDRLIAFHGLKEDISLAGVAVDQVSPTAFRKLTTTVSFAFSSVRLPRGVTTTTQCLGISHSEPLSTSQHNREPLSSSRRDTLGNGPISGGAPGVTGPSCSKMRFPLSSC
jgi:hypothetical protein